MPWPLLNIWIPSCKLMICVAVFLSLNSHHWFRDATRGMHSGPQFHCYDYGSRCFQRNHMKKGVWFFQIAVLMNLTLELLNILLLCWRARARLNLLLEELALIGTGVFLLPAGFVAFGLLITSAFSLGEQFDWSYAIFATSVVLASIDFICSFVRVVSYCREHSFRSEVITYSSGQQQGTVHIQSA